MAAEVGTNSSGKAWHMSVVTLLMIYLALPVLATLLYSLTHEWQGTILPRKFTLEWYAYIFGDARFLSALGRSLLVSTITVIAALVIMIPTIFVVAIYYPKWEKVLQTLVLLPFALPGVVAAVGLMKLYSSGPIAISGTIWILIAAYFIMILPFVYQSTRNSLRTINAKDLVEAAEVLGARKMVAFRLVILPNILPGVMIASLLSFSILIGEFVLANIMVGGSYETIQIYLYRIMNTNGHIASATIVTFFGLVFILSGIVLKLGNWKKKEYTASQEEEEQ
jgi:putative spermidine/putrescine transport system permease protein